MTSRKSAPRILICSNTAWSVYNFRRSLIVALIADGYEVVVVAPPDEYAEKLPGLGCRYIPLPMDNRGTSPLRDLRLLLRFWQMLRRERPVAYLGYTIKPNVYGSLAAHSLGIPVINNIAGLGAAFIRASWLTEVAKLLYRLALGRSQRVFFQNREDRELFIAKRLVREAQAGLLPGSGVDLARFSPAPPRPADGEIRFLLVARMLWDKGVGEFVEAARRTRRAHPEARFQLLGFLDVPNPAAIERSVVEGWVAEGVVEYLGVTEDVRPHLAAADCVVLPSYREGLSRSLIEAAALGRPLIATDVPGCREVVDDGVNGFLVAPRDATPLAAALATFCSLTMAQRTRMGASSRQKAVSEFDETVVVDRYRHEITRAINARKRS
ncbi:MAG: glycosyltransferase [Devosia sp.]|uniref:glycosyltransferase family 4 protein n=1 Tax=Devosia sp. TaxID=1871048 RepID=UPI0026264A80|nr:glycosyltransferase family 4 protein [Devosia sp.]MDB5540760.1 glycosyltransferase [Devosia sp.]